MHQDKAAISHHIILLVRNNQVYLTRIHFDWNMALATLSAAPGELVCVYATGHVSAAHRLLRWDRQLERPD